MTKKTRLIFMYSGQGSQYYQMGKELRDDPIFSYWMKEGEKILKNLGCSSFLETLYDNHTRDPWHDLLSTHPGLVIIEYAVFQVLKNFGVIADAVLGFSVGEFTAVAVAGACTFEEAVKAAFKQAKLVIDLCEKGGMTAILASPNIYKQSSVLNKQVHLAGINCAEHFLISGRSDELMEAHQTLNFLDQTYISLPVDYAFHSKEIEEAQLPFEEYCKTHLQFKTPKIPLISGLTGLPLTKIPDSYLWDVVHQPLSFQHVISILEVDDDKTLYVDLGPSGTLATFLKYNLPQKSQSSGISLLTPFHNGRTNIEKLLIHLKEENLF